MNTILISVNPNDTVKFEYDVLGNRTFIADPDTGEVAELYDGFGRLLRQIDAGDTTTYEYDNLGRLTRSSGTEAEINYAYNADTTSKAFGQVDSIYNTAGTLSESYTYDNTLGRLTGVTRKIPTKPLPTLTVTIGMADFKAEPIRRGFRQDTHTTAQGILKRSQVQAERSGSAML